MGWMCNCGNIVHGCAYIAIFAGAVVFTLPLRFSEVVEKVAKKNFPECWNNKRVEFIPVDWRTGLTLDSGSIFFSN